VTPGLCDLAIMLLRLPSSSASTEDANQTKLSNRLGLVKAAMLVSSYREHRGGAELDW